MRRREVEKKIAEHMIAIKEIYGEYNPGGDYLALTLLIGKDGNDDGDWPCWFLMANNCYSGKDEARPINFFLTQAIDSEERRKYMDEEDNAEAMKHDEEDGNLLRGDYVYYSLQC